jgi:hypothetical protein
MPQACALKKPAKPRSRVIHCEPDSIASAAKPRLAHPRAAHVGVNAKAAKNLPMPLARLTAQTMQLAELRRLWQKSKASRIAFGALKTLILVGIRTTARRTMVDRPSRASPQTTSSHGRQTACCGRSAKRAYQDIDIRQHHVRRMSRRTASISAASPISCKSLALDTGQQPAACLVNQWQDAFGLRRLAVIGNEYSQPLVRSGISGCGPRRLPCTWHGSKAPAAVERLLARDISPL